MNTIKKGDLIDEMITELDHARTTKEAQIANISDVAEKSNNILLQIESSQNTKPVQDDSISNRYIYSKETLYALAKNAEIFERLMVKMKETHQTPEDFETYITTTRVRIDFLGSAVRKLLALNDTVNQIGSELLNDEEDFELDTSGNAEGNSSE